MNKAYLIAPTVLIAAFLAVQRPAERRIEAAAAAHAAEVAATRAAEDAHRRAAQEQAGIAARQRTAENEKQERLKAEAKQAAYEDRLRRIDADTATQLATNDTLTRDLATLDEQLVTLRAQHDATDRAVFDLTKRVELQRTERRLADLEFQRLATMLAQRVADRPEPTNPVRALTPSR